MFQTINMAQTALVRMPFLFASLNGALLAGEVAYRVCQKALEAIGFQGTHPSARKISHIIAEVRPYQNLLDRPLLIKTVVCCAVGILGLAATNALLGAPHPIYNRALSYLGPIRISNDTHPWLAAAVDYTNRKFG